MASTSIGVKRRPSKPSFVTRGDASANRLCSAVSKEDKATIRERLLESGVNEADQRLALQNAIVIGKIVRFEFPNDW
jgi:hypothetical protein